MIAEELGGWVPMSRFGRWLWGESFTASEGSALIVFVRGDHDVTGYRDLNRGEDLGAFVDANGIVVLSRDEAGFRVSRGDLASDWTLTPATE